MIGFPGHHNPYLSQSQYSKRLAGKLSALEFLLFPLPGFHGGVRKWNVPAGSHYKGYGVFGCGNSVDPN